jgi:hypothetical protein
MDELVDFELGSFFETVTASRGLGYVLSPEQAQELATLWCRAKELHLSAETRQVF